MISGYFPWRMIMSNTSVTPVKKITKTQAAKPVDKNSKGHDREKMIADAAYFRAKNRSFEGGDSMSDWLISEAEIDEVLKNH
jgi:hypothetical protein